MERFSSHRKERTEPAEHWDEQDTSEILETGEVEELEIPKMEYRCPSCGSGRVRKRMIDLPIFEGKLVLNKLKVNFCVDCKTSVIEEASLDEFEEKLYQLATGDRKKFRQILNEALALYDKKWQERVSQRKVISIYFPTKEGSPAKAHISIMASDPLYRKISDLSSEAIRSLLGIQFYEDLEAEAIKEQRSISQYLKLALTGRLRLQAGRNPKESTIADEKPLIVLYPERVTADHFKKASPHTKQLALAAKSKEEELLIFQTTDRRFIGILDYDYEKASLYLQVERDELGLRFEKAELMLKDNRQISLQNLHAENNRILLLSDTTYTEKDVAKVVIRPKS